MCELLYYVQLISISMKKDQDKRPYGEQTIKEKACFRKHKKTKRKILLDLNRF